MLQELKKLVFENKTSTQIGVLVWCGLCYFYVAAEAETRNIAVVAGVMTFLSMVGAAVWYPIWRYRTGSYELDNGMLQRHREPRKFWKRLIIEQVIFTLFSGAFGYMGIDIVSEALR